MKQNSKPSKIPTTEDPVFFIKQIVGNMSTFIGQIAEDVQGGVHYFNELPYFVSIHSRDGTILSTNQTYREHLGDREGENSWCVYEGRHSTDEENPVIISVESGKPAVTRAVVRYLSGAKVPVIVHTAPIFDPSGDVMFVIEVFAGSREIDRLSEEISTTQQRYQQLFDAVPSYISVLDRRARITAVNRKFKEDFGDQTGNDFFEVFRLSDADSLGNPIIRTLEDGDPHQADMVLNTEQGDHINVLAWTSPIKTPAGKLVQILTILMDVTEVRQLKDNLSSLGLMVSTISHHIRGSLTGLDAGLYLVEKGFYRNKPGRIEEGLDVAKLMQERIRKLVADILYYAKERDLDSQNEDVLKFAGDVAANVATKIRGADITFNCEFSPDLGMIEIDATLVRASLTNLLENAVEACIEDTQSKSYQIDFKVVKEGNDIRFDISDNGCGMQKDQVQKAFNLFYSSKGHKGTGLGLFVTKQIIRKHGGKIALDSKPGEGTRFSIWLPRKIQGIVR